MFWYRWPSIVVELLSGVLLVGICLLWTGGLVPGAAGTALLVSVIYEKFFDPNGWSWGDVVQRGLGIALGLALWNLLG